MCIRDRAYTIAVAGKGGVGKTTLCGLLIQYLGELKKTPILAVDADANSNLNEVLGVEVEMTLGDVREEVNRAENSSKNPIPAGMSKADYTEFMFNRCLVEDDDFDLLVMGRTQGKGCYCFVNGLLQAQLQKLTPHYQCVVVDNEAGMEHISRGILPKVDAVILVSDCSRRGVQAVGRIAELVKECELNPKQMGLIINLSLIHILIIHFISDFEAEKELQPQRGLYYLLTGLWLFWELSHFLQYI